MPTGTYLHKRGIRIGEKAAHWQGGKIKRICLVCGREFEIWNYRKDTAKYCSQECFGNALIGFKHSDKTRRKMSKSKMGHFTSEKTKRKISESHKGKPSLPQQGFRKGKLHYNWKDGATPKNKKIRQSPEFKEWREKVFERDNYTCWICEDRGGNGHKVILHPHHLKGFADYPKLRFDINNGLTLCKFCHKTYTNWGVNKSRK